MFCSYFLAKQAAEHNMLPYVNNAKCYTCLWFTVYQLIHNITNNTINSTHTLFNNILFVRIQVSSAVQLTSLLFGVLRGIGWYLVTDVSGQTVGLIFRGVKQSRKERNDCMIVEDGTDGLSRNVGNQVPAYAA
jgi:hypothetical protein